MVVSILNKVKFFTKDDNIVMFKDTLVNSRQDIRKLLINKVSIKWGNSYFIEVDVLRFPFKVGYYRNIGDFYSSLNIDEIPRYNKILLKEVKLVLKQLEFPYFIDPIIVRNIEGVFRVYLFKSSIGKMKFKLLHIYFLPLVLILFMVLNVLLVNMREFMLK